MDKIVFGFIGTTLDAGFNASRWERWRPTVALCQQEDVLIHRLVLFHGAGNDSLLKLIQADIKRVSPETIVEPVLLVTKDPWDFVEVYSALHDFVRRYQFDTERYEYWVHITTGTHVAQICLFLLTEARYFPAKLLQTSPPRRGGFPDTAQLTVVDLDLSQYNQLASRFEEERQEDVSFLKFGIATQNARFNRTIAEIEQVALRSQTPILLTGPTGAGKSFLARRIYELKKAKHQLHGNFIDVNCATLRGEGAMSALFGHIKGAFTGALQARAGYLKAADDGLLFLDEIGELGLDEQAMLLKAIEEKRFFPLGSDKEVSSQFQFIAGTHRDLAQDVRNGRFREDLFARINTWLYSLPGLKDRREDIEPNLDFELERIADQFGKKIRFNSDAKRSYLDYAMATSTVWAGNFRDLSGSLLRMATLADVGRIDTEAVEKEIERLQLRQPSNNLELKNEGMLLDHPDWLAMKDQIDPFDQVQLAYVIQVCQTSHSLSDAGRSLFHHSRKDKKISNDADRLRKYLGKFDLSFSQVSTW